MGSASIVGLPDSSNAGTVWEDRCFGVVHDGGVSRIVVRRTSGGTEVDHLQYGR